MLRYLKTLRFSNLGLGIEKKIIEKRRTVKILFLKFEDMRQNTENMNANKLYEWNNRDNYFFLRLVLTHFLEGEPSVVGDSTTIPIIFWPFGRRWFGFNQPVWFEPVLVA